MARIAVILLLFCPRLSAGEHLLLIAQNDPSFQADGRLWQNFFKGHNSKLIVISLKEYSSQEVKVIFNRLESKLTSKDTLILVISAHTVQYGYCTILKFTKGDLNLKTDLIFKEDYEAFLSSMNDKGIRTIVIMNSCEPTTVIHPAFIMSLKNVTIVYSDEEYSICNKNEGSLAGIILQNSPQFSSLKQYLSWLNTKFLDKNLYYGFDKTLKKQISDYYPQKSTLYGPNFIF